MFMLRLISDGEVEWERKWLRVDSRSEATGPWPHAGASMRHLPFALDNSNEVHTWTPRETHGLHFPRLPW
jgi:hypothetical protein